MYNLIVIAIVILADVNGQLIAIVPEQGAKTRK